MFHPILGWRRRSSRCQPRCAAADCSHRVLAVRSATARPVQPAMAVSGSPLRPEKQLMSLSTLGTALPSGMSRAIKPLDTESATPASLNVHFGDSQSQYHRSNTGLTNIASRLICTRCASISMKNHYNAFISRTSDIVNALFSFLERRADPIGTRCPSPVKVGLSMGGKFIYPPRLSKRLGTMGFLAGSGRHAVDALFL